MAPGTSALAGVLGPLLASLLVAVTVVLLGLSPVLGLVAGAVVAVDVLYYRRHAGSDRAAGLTADGRTG